MIAALMAPLGTLPFLGTLWLLMILGARILEEDGGKILAALKGVPPTPPANDVGVRGPARARVQTVTRVTVEWRAAA